VSRGTRATLQLDALRHNLGVVRAASPDSRVMAVVKANAYGHGLERVVGALAGADAFAVATLGEARRVRTIDADRPVLLLEGITTGEELAVVRDLRLDLVVHAAFQLDLFEDRAPGDAMRCWLKVNTGMNRLGFPPGDAAAALQRLRATAAVSEVVLMSHFANADEPDDPATPCQIERFETLCRELSTPDGPSFQRSLANSAGAFAWPASRLDWLRAGLALYGESPFADRSAADLGLRPCMSLRSTLIAVNDCAAGDAVGYGGDYRCPESMAIGIVAIGYGDGYPRHAPSGTPVLVRGVRCPLVGRVSMDMLAVDLRPVPEAAIGDDVLLWGEGLPVAEIARAAGTIPYELTCGVSSRVDVDERGAGVSP